MSNPELAINPAFDPGKAVAEQYDVFCEGCGYSLLGLSGDRCPECGKPYEPLALPYARIPWLHRRRIGRVRAYCRTIAMVMFGPTRFASELCRPVRISADDARRFRSLTIWLATLALVALIIGWPILDSLLTKAPLPWRIPFWPPARWWYMVGRFQTWQLIPLLPAVLGFHLFLRLATDMPLFVWKGLPSLGPTELSPVHHYASAPLAVFIVGIPLILAVQPMRAGSYRQAQVGDQIVACYAVVLVILWMLWTWAVSLKMMKAAGGASRRQLRQLALYLPFHWLLMAGGIAIALFELAVYGDVILKPLHRIWFGW